MGNTPICTIDATGIHRPALSECISYLETNYSAIYGSDSYLGSDSQDGEILGLFAAAYDDGNSMAVQTYNAFSPATAQGVGLSINVKMNGLTRDIPSYSVSDVTLVGQYLTVIQSGVVTDTNGYDWALPSSVEIPFSGQIDVTATCTTLGAITANPGTINQIKTGTNGWQTVTNAAAATPGLPVEEDPILRMRQYASVTFPASSGLESIIAGIASTAGVIGYRGYENDTDLPDANGQSSHSVCMVVNGGSDINIATVINRKKVPGTGTFGTTSVMIADAYGIPHQINFSRAVPVPITFAITIKALSGFTADVQTQIAQAVSDWTNAIGIGNNLLLNRANVPANLGGSTLSQTYEIVSLNVSAFGGTLSSSDITIAFNQMATCSPSSITFTVT